jgi:hypothetical protein
LHPSRVIPFIGQKVPEGGFYQSPSWFWGDPIMQSIGSAVKNADTAQSGFASLIDRAAIDVFKFKDLIAQAGTPEGEERITRRVAWTSQSKSLHRAMLIDMEDDWEQVQANWSGIPDTLNAFLNVVAGASDIPVTRLLGQSPKGLRSTGDGEERDYHSMVKSWQDDLLAPGLFRADEVLIPSALGSRPSDVHWSFSPLAEETEAEGADIENKYADTFSKLVATGELPSSAVTKIIQNRMIESGRFPGAEKAFEDAANEPQPDEQDPDQLTTIEQRVAAMEKAGTVTTDQAFALLADAAPRTLYVQRKLLNADAVIAWAKSQGFETTLPADQMHVTVLYSRQPVDWMKMGSGWDQDADGKLKVPPGGPRMLDQFGSLKPATVLLFTSSSLCWRHEDMVSKGASHDFDEYVPHVTITYDAPADLDLSKVEPYRGELIFGPEIFEAVNEDWKAGVSEES